MASATDVALACRKRAKFLDHHSARMLRRSNTAADKNQIVSGTLVSYYAFFERQLEALFMGLLVESLQHPTADVRPLASFPSFEAAQVIVRDGRNYIDWLPFDHHTKKRAAVYFEDSEPFDRLDTSQRRLLEEFGLLRNALAHQSSHSLKRFQTEFVDGENLPTPQCSPAGYLRGDQALGVTRLRYYLSGAVGTMARLCT